MNWSISFTTVSFIYLSLFSVKSYTHTIDLTEYISAKCNRNLSPDLNHVAEFSSFVCEDNTTPNEDPECQSDCKFILTEFRRRCNFTKEIVDYISDSFNVARSCFEDDQSYSDNLKDFLPKKTYCQDGNTKVSPGDVVLKPCSQVIGNSFDGNAVYLCSNAGNFLVNVKSCKAKVINTSLFSDVIPKNKTTIENTNNTTSGLNVREMLLNVTKHIESIKQFGKILNSAGLLKLSKLVLSVGQFLGPIGVAFSILGSFTLEPEKGEEDHQELLRRLDQLDNNMEEVSDRIADLSNHVTKKLFESEFREHRMKLYYVEHDIKAFVENPSNYTKRLLVERCKSNKALELMIWFDEILKDISKDGFAELYEYHRNVYSQAFAQPAMTYLIRSMSAQIKCAGMLGATENDIKIAATTLQLKSEAVIERLNYMYNEHFPDYAISKTLEKDLKNLIDTHKGLSKKDLSILVYNELGQKYDYVKWGATVYDNYPSTLVQRKNSNCHKCAGKTSSGMFSLCRDNGNCVNVMYSNNTLSSNYPDSVQLKNLANSDNDWNQDLGPKLSKLWSISPVQNLLIVAKSLNIQNTYDPDYVYTQEIQTWHYEEKFIFWKKQVLKTIIVTLTY